MASTMNQFFLGRSVFITGTTGLLGKVLLEKLLRTCPDIRAVYILVRAKKGKDAAQRLKDILSSMAFDKIKANNSTVLEKINVLNGDISLPFLGLDSSDVELLAENVSIVFHLAATIKFKEPIQYAIKTNLLSVRHLLQVCHKMNQLAAVIHVSTAFSNYNRASIEEIVYTPNINPSKVIEIFDNLDDKNADKMWKQIVGDFPNTYICTKFLAEYLFMEEGGNLPRAIVRPSIVTCAWEDPFPGWIDNLSALGGLEIAIGLGITRHFLLDPNIAIQIVPVDFCANMIIAAARETALNNSSSVIAKVYHCTTGGATKITYGIMYKLWARYLKKFPLNNMVRIPRATSYRSYFAQYILSLWDYYFFLCPMDYLLKITGNKFILRKIFCAVKHNLELAEFVTKKEWQLCNENAMKLWNSLTAEERTVFNFDQTQINWAKYYEDNAYGRKVYLLQENVSTIPTARRRHKILLWSSRFWSIFKWTLLWIFLFRECDKHFKIANI